MVGGTTRAAAPCKQVEIGALVRDKQLHQGWDEEYGCHILDEERICDELEDMMEEGGVVVDFHGAELFPARRFLYAHFSMEFRIPWSALSCRFPSPLAPSSRHLRTFGHALTTPSPRPYHALASMVAQSRLACFSLLRVSMSR